MELSISHISLFFYHQVMQQCGIEDEQVVFVLEDHHVVDISFLEIVNSLLSAGEVPGLYTPEELEPLLAPIRDQASEEGFRGPLVQYFANSKYLYHGNCGTLGCEFWSKFVNGLLFVGGSL